RRVLPNEVPLLRLQHLRGAGSAGPAVCRGAGERDRDAAPGAPRWATFWAGRPRHRQHLLRRRDAEPPVSGADRRDPGGGAPLSSGGRRGDYARGEPGRSIDRILPSDPRPGGEPAEPRGAELRRRDAAAPGPPARWGGSRRGGRAGAAGWLYQSEPRPDVRAARPEAGPLGGDGRPGARPRAGASLALQPHDRGRDYLWAVGGRG